MDDLAAFLGQRYDEAEALARGVEDHSAPWDGQWVAEESGRALRTRNGWVLTYLPYPDREFAPGFLDHVAAVDPAHRLADIALKRAILALHFFVVSKREQHRYDSYSGVPIGGQHDGHCAICGWFDPEHGGCLTVRQLGTEFSGHPGYRSEWAP